MWALLEAHERQRLLEEEARANEQAELRWLRERCVVTRGGGASWPPPPA